MRQCEREILRNGEQARELSINITESLECNNFRAEALNV